MLLRRFWAGIVALTALSLLFTAVMTYHLHTRVPYGLALLYGQDFGWDFLVYQHRFLMFRQPNFWTTWDYPLTYPALLGVAFAALYKLAHPLRDYLAFCMAMLLLWAGWLARRLRRESIARWQAWGFAATVLLLLWPAWLVIDTGNIEGLVAATLGLGLLCIAKQRWWLGASLIGLAGAMKLFPLLLLALLLSRRRYKEFAWGVVLALTCTVASLAILGPTVGEAQRQIDRGFGFLTNNFGLSVLPDALDANHSLYVVVKTAVVLAHHRHLSEDARTIPTPEQVLRDRAMLEMPYRVYLGAMAVFGIAAYFLRIRHMPLLNQMLALTLCAVLMPPVSMDYTLLHLLVPFNLLCLFAVRHESARGLPAALLCFALIFTPLTFFSVRWRLVCQARSLLLVALVCVVLRYAWPWPALDEEAAA